MPKAQPTAAELRERRDFVNEKFIEYSALDRIHGNYEPLANLAAIGTRLDALLDRQQKREDYERMMFPGPETIAAYQALAARRDTFYARVCAEDLTPWQKLKNRLWRAAEFHDGGVVDTQGEPVPSATERLLAGFARRAEARYQEGERRRGR